MSLLHYIDNEVPAFGEWDAVVQAGSSTIVQSTDAAFPERGAVGLRTTVVGTDRAYVTRNDVATLSPGEGYHVGFWLRVPVAPPLEMFFIISRIALNDFFIKLSNYGKLRLQLRDDAGSYHSTSYSQAIDTGRWVYVVANIVRASSPTANDGRGELFVDGLSAGSVSGLDNYDTLDGTSYIRIGASSGVSDGFTCDFDEIKIGTSLADVEPFSPEPNGDYVEARRTVVLVPDSSDGREFADYCISELQTPRSLICYLPNASSSESLADYATFQSQVENDLTSFLNGRPVIEARACAFLIGYGTPGFFTSSGKLHSATSRLNHFGTAFSSGTANPFYQTTTRKTASEIRAENLWLATRIDADTLANAKALIDRAATIETLSALPDTDILYSDDADYRASVDCQKLRIATAASGDMLTPNAAFVLGVTGITDLDASGSRVTVVDDGENDTATLRSVSDWVTYGLLAAGYASGAGFANSSPTGFDKTAFCELLRVGATFAEAALAAVEKVDHTSVVAGSPLMTVAFLLAGYNFYLGTGGVEDIDWNNPVAYAKPEDESMELHLPLESGLRNVLGLRKVSSAGVEERNTHVVIHLETDTEDALLPAPLARPFDTSAEIVPDAHIRVGFSYETPAGHSQPAGFEVFSDSGSGILDLQTPIYVVSDVPPSADDVEVTFPIPQTPSNTIRIAVRAIANGQTSSLGKVVSVKIPTSPAVPAFLQGDQS